MSLKARILSVMLIATPVVGYFEGRSLFAYLDPVGRPTICDGWTRGVRLSEVATPAQCDAKTQLALNEAATVFAQWVPANVIDGMSDRSIAAFLSFIYNVGPGKPGVKDGFVWLKNGRHSTMLLQLQAGKLNDACDQLPHWDKAGGRPLRGLVLRRAAERKLCKVGL